ncbi:RsmD family RNA methyltransferase [Treponema sp. HNW]|uniref:class I SAM-dependent RNA methyltransferase n=1 Tax=Treponema sp. HNW TaxID=3116654 RepID=UPI003D134815
MIHIIAQKAVFGGDCIGKINGKTVFIGSAAGVLPGEELEVEIVLSKKDYDKAAVKKIVKTSPHRTQPFCPHYGLCGGCNFQYASYAYQLELKKNIAQDLLVRSLGNEGAMPQIQIVSGPDTEYRSRFQFHSGGLKQRKSDDIVRLKDCPCAVKPLRTLLQSGALAAKKVLNTERMTVFADERLIGGTKEAASSKIVCASDASPVCTISLNGKCLSFDVRGFFQSNMHMLEKTLPLITKDLRGKRLLDMYGGTGVLSLFAAENFESVTIVESDKRSLSFAETNYRNNGIHCKLNTYTMRGSEWAQKHLKQGRQKSASFENRLETEHFDALIIDPPRTGIEKEVIDYIAASKPPIIRSLSCDPATHARDLKRLVQAGYTITDFRMLDFYPHTSHMESLACLIYSGNR